jgi:hypothetical protein
VKFNVKICFQQGKKMILDEKRGILDSLISPKADHVALGKGEVKKFEYMAKELTKITKDKYYENEYHKQVKNYKDDVY